MPVRANAFPAASRLSGRLRFAMVYDAKTKRTAGPLVAYSLPNDLKQSRLGLSVSRRVGTAPRRNRIKRMLREAFRLHHDDSGQGYDLIIVVRPHAATTLPKYQSLLGKLLEQSHADWEKPPPRAPEP